jgi:endonuclease/exonuclease/phosphatase family metal-dependent hydrolase
VRLLAVALLGLGAFACSPGESGAPPISVMSFNIRYGTANDGDNSWPHRSEMVVAVLRDHTPDVVGVQEALRFQLDELLSALPAYDELGVGREDGDTAGEYAAILYRPDRFEAEQSGTFWLSDTPDVPGSMSWGNRITRICTWARFARLDTEDRFYVYNLHLDHQSQPSREHSVALLAQRIAARPTDHPYVVLGDFNAGENNPAVRFLTGAADGLVEDVDATVGSPHLRDTYRALHSNPVGVGTFNAFRGETGGEKIDWILVSDAWEVLDAAIVRTSTNGRYPSDHFPVTALIRSHR